jgi:hypothetical protein
MTFLGKKYNYVCFFKSHLFFNNILYNFTCDNLCN